MKRKKQKYAKIIFAVLTLSVMFPLVSLADINANDINSNLPNPTLNLNDSTTGTSSNSGGWSLSSIQQYGLPEGSILDIIKNILLWLLAALGIIGVIGFVIAGIMYLISAGDEDMAGKAKNAMKWSIYGVVVALAGLVIIQAIYYALTGTTSIF